MRFKKRDAADYGKNIKIKFVGDGYETVGAYKAYIKMFNRHIDVPDRMYSDGATSAPDLKHTDSWLIHDAVCRYGKWADGTLISNFVASTILATELWKDGYRKESFYWWWATYLKGGGQARKNGMFIATEPK